ncbi:MAG: hypothetical protein LH472_07760 [Pyrinomonadaceae bacterium]|nr:hypothetical protein [Pyrinomonadaceae bacterium]
MILENFAGSPLIENLGWTLLHSVWQIAFAAFWLWLALRVFPKSVANARYSVSLSALVLAFVLPLLSRSAYIFRHNADAETRTK